MIKLIKLEYKKHKVSKYIIAAIIITVAIAIFSFAQTFLGIARDAETGIIDMAEGANTVSSYVEMFTTIAFIVLSCAMQASFIVDEYRNKTMEVMFQYPIQRRKIIISKILAVILFNFIALALCKLIVYGIIYVGSLTRTADFLLTGINFLSPAFYLTILFQSFTTVLLSTIALYIGFLAKSTKATIISSLLIIAITQGSIGNLSLPKSALTTAILIAISIGCAFLCVARIDTKDVDGGK